MSLSVLRGALHENRASIELLSGLAVIRRSGLAPWNAPVACVTMSA
jgi:hypothetical protein